MSALTRSKPRLAAGQQALSRSDTVCVQVRTAAPAVQKSSASFHLKQDHQASHEWLYVGRLDEPGATKRGAVAPCPARRAASRPRDPESRRQMMESGRPVVIGANVWIGAGGVILPRDHQTKWRNYRGGHCGYARCALKRAGHRGSSTFAEVIVSYRRRKGKGDGPGRCNCASCLASAPTSPCDQDGANPSRFCSATVRSLLRLHGACIRNANRRD